MPIPPKELQDEFASYVEEIDKLEFEEREMSTGKKKLSDKRSINC